MLGGPEARLPTTREAERTEEAALAAEHLATDHDHDHDLGHDRGDPETCPRRQRPQVSVLWPYAR
jgi:hypothetical protein